MAFSLVFSAAQLKSAAGADFGLGSYRELKQFASQLRQAGFQGNLYEMPCQLKNPTIASPFSLASGFALSLDEIDFFQIPELAFCPDFQQQLEALQASHEAYFRQGQMVNYGLKRSLLPWVLTELFPHFSKRSPAREKIFQQFLQQSHYWLENFTLYEALRAEGSELLVKEFYRGRKKQELLERTKEARAYYCYTQFVAYEQRLDWVNWAKKQGLELMLNLPFGVERQSADVFFHSDVFLPGLQVGCSPEPYNGYPEQAWGIAAYRECSKGLQEYLQARLDWLQNFGHGIFLDHLVGWCGQYVLPSELDPHETLPQGDFLTEDPAKRRKNILWFLKIVAASGLAIVGEIAGDLERVDVTHQAVAELQAAGLEITSMRIPRWEMQEGRLMPLRNYPADALCMLETHDTSTLLQYLCNVKGNAADFETVENLLEFAHQVLAWPLLEKELPLALVDLHHTEIYSQVMEEVLLRLAASNPSGEVAMTYGGLVSGLLLQPQSLGIQNNINIQPGTSGLVGNERLNWSLFNPDLELIPQLQPFFEKLSRQRPLFAPVQVLRQAEQGHPTCLLAEVQKKQVLWKNEEGKWAIAPKQGDAKWELVLHNPWEGEVSGMLALGDLEPDGLEPGDLEVRGLKNNQNGVAEKQRETLLLRDLNTGEEYQHSMEKLRQEGLYYRLQAGQKQHFLLF